MKGKTFIISGPSGVGKSTALNELLKDKERFYFSISATTRKPRPGEQDGVNYHFIDKQTFEQMIENDEFLEHAQFVDNYYGTPKRYVDEAMNRGQDVILDIEFQGAEQVHEKRPDATRIFILPPSFEELERRLRSRGSESDETIKKRLERAKFEISKANQYDYQIICTTTEETVQNLLKIINEVKIAR